MTQWLREGPQDTAFSCHRSKLGCQQAWCLSRFVCQRFMLSSGIHSHARSILQAKLQRGLINIDRAATNALQFGVHHPIAIPSAVVPLKMLNFIANPPAHTVCMSWKGAILSSKRSKRPCMQ